MDTICIILTIIDVVLLIFNMCLAIWNKEILRPIIWFFKGQIRKNRTFTQSCNAVDKLAMKISNNEHEFKPDIIVGIDGGGYIVAAMLSGKLETDMLTINMKREGSGRAIDVEEESLKKLKCDYCRSICSKNVLLVDDDSTGNTLSLARKALVDECKAKRIEFAVLSRRTDNQLNSRNGDYPLSSADYKFWIWQTVNPIKYPWRMFWSP